jgi:hypothetical protein
MGKVTRSASVTTDDPANAAFSLTLSYEAINLLTVDPPRLVLMNFMAGVPSDSREIRVTAQQPPITAQPAGGGPPNRPS